MSSVEDFISNFRAQIEYLHERLLLLAISLFLYLFYFGASQSFYVATISTVVLRSSWFHKLNFIFSTEIRGEHIF